MAERKGKPYLMKNTDVGTGALDFSYLLDAPAGKHGFVSAKDGKFRFENGKAIRFFGVNLVFGGAMPEKEVAVQIADRLAASGINMVRMHHVDSYQTGEQSNTLIDYSEGHSRKLHAENFDRMDYLVHELKQRGIYLHIDLFTLRRYLPGDGLEYEDELAGALKSVNYYNRRLIDLHKEFASLYLLHRNPYTGLRYIDEPAVAIVQLLNENGIFWDNAEAEAPSYRKELDRRWNEWLQAKYQTREALDEAWTRSDGTQGLGAGEDPALGNVARPPIGIWGERKISANRDYASVEGPARFAEHIDFLSQIEMAYIREMMDDLKELGVKCPINASNLPFGAAELRCLSLGEVAENNGYWNHPMGGFRVPVTFHDKEMHRTDPRQPQAEAFAQNLVSKLAIGRVTGKPFVVTEWNVSYPARFRADVMLMLASYAALQDWDGLLLFSYSHSGGKELNEAEGFSGFFNSYNDPAVWGLAGVASALFQGRLVKEAANEVELAYTALDALNTPPEVNLPFGYVPFISRIAGTFVEDEPYAGTADVVISSGFTSTGDYTSAKHALVYARSPYRDRYQKTIGKADFLRLHQEPEGSTKPIVTLAGQEIGKLGSRRAVIKREEVLDSQIGVFGQALDQSMKHWGLLASDRGYDEARGTFVSDTGELTFGYGGSGFRVETDRLVAFAGEVNGSVSAAGFRFDLNNRKASISLLSRDNRPLTESGHMLLSAVSECWNEGMAWEEKTLVDEGEGPVMIEQVTGRVFIPSRRSACSAYALDAAGRRIQELNVTKEEGGFQVELDTEQAAIAFEIKLRIEK
jgi:hypothetical protein